jgi:hypothetical protein
MPAHPPTNDGTVVPVEPEDGYEPDSVPPQGPPPPAPIED